MELQVLYIILIVILFLASYVGLLFPVLPSTILLWFGFLIYRFALGGLELSVFFWVAMVGFTALVTVADIFANSYLVKRYGGSTWGNRVAGFSVIIGSFVYPPFGLLFVPFLAVYLTEILQKKTQKEALRSALGSLLGFLSGTFAKIVIQSIMIIWFIVDVFVM